MKTNTGPCLFVVPCHGASRSFRVYPNFLPPLFSHFHFFPLLFLRPTLPSGFDPSGPLLCVQCLSKQQQQQTAVCSAASGMQLLSKEGSSEKNEKVLYRIKLLSDLHFPLSLSLYVKRSLSSPRETGDNSHDHAQEVAQCMCLVLTLFVASLCFSLYS